MSFPAPPPLRALDLRSTSIPLGARADESLSDLLRRVGGAAAAARGGGAPFATGVGVLDALRDGLGLRAGECAELCGASGSGKTLALVAAAARTLVATQPAAAAGTAGAGAGLSAEALPAPRVVFVDLDFKLHAPLNTTVEGSVSGGKLVGLVVTPPERASAVRVVNCAS
jgi:hypothetical protein